MLYTKSSPVKKIENLLAVKLPAPSKTCVYVCEWVTHLFFLVGSQLFFWFGFRLLISFQVYEHSRMSSVVGTAGLWSLASWLCCVGLVVKRHAGCFWACVPCLGWWILKHWTTRGVSTVALISTSLMITDVGPVFTCYWPFVFSFLKRCLSPLLSLKNIFWLREAACGILVPGPGIELPVLEAQSLDHWTDMEVSAYFWIRLL